MINMCLKWSHFFVLQDALIAQPICTLLVTCSYTPGFEACLNSVSNGLSLYATTVAVLYSVCIFSYATRIMIVVN